MLSLLCEVYQTPASAAGIESNHKFNKRRQCARLERMGDGRMERQAVVAHNDTHRIRNFEKKRSPFESFTRIFVRLGLDDDGDEQAGHDSSNDHRNNHLEHDDDMMDIEAVVYAAYGTLDSPET